MKTNVNLYSPEFRPKLRLLSLHFILSFWLISLCVCLSVYAYFSYQHKQFSAEMDNVERNKQQQIALLEQLKSELKNLVVDPALLEKANKRQGTIKFKKRVLDEVEVQSKFTSHAFSDLMIELAANNKSGLWLTHIHIDKSDVMIEGAALSSALIPQWVNSLSNTKFFQGQEFSETRLYRDKAQQLIFVLSTEQALKNSELASNE